MNIQNKYKGTSKLVRTVVQAPYKLVRLVTVIPYKAVRKKRSERTSKKDVLPERVQIFIPERLDVQPDMYVQDPHTNTVQPVQPEPVRTGKFKTFGMNVLYTFMGVLLTGVITSPIALSAQSVIDWAGSKSGLGLNSPWTYVVFGALDAAAASCVLMVLICAWKGESPGVFRILVWVFTASAATANYQEGVSPDAPGKATWWFMPLMSILGPVILEAVLAQLKDWIRRADGRRAEVPPSMADYGWSRWIPGIGAFQETFGAFRLARLAGISTVELSIDLYRQLMPVGGWRVAKTWRTAQRVHAERSEGVRTPIVIQRVYLNNSEPVQVQDVQPVQVQEPVHTPESRQPVMQPEHSKNVHKNWVVQNQRVQNDEERLQKIRAAFPNELPNKSKIRTLLGTNNDIAGRLLAQLEKEESK